MLLHQHCTVRVALNDMVFSRTGLASLKGKTLVAAITSVCSSGFLLFGYGTSCTLYTQSKTVADLTQTRAS